MVVYLCACNLSKAETMPPGRICRNIATISTCRNLPGKSTYTDYVKLGVLVNYNTSVLVDYTTTPPHHGITCFGSHMLTRTPKPFDWGTPPFERRKKKHDKNFLTV
jgi:hypothetical protein